MWKIVIRVSEEVSAKHILANILTEEDLPENEDIQSAIVFNEELEEESGQN